MYTLDEILSIDRGVEVKSSLDQKCSFEGISKVDHLNSKHLVFIKDRKFLEKVKHSLSAHKTFDVALFIDKKTFESLDKEDLVFFKSHAAVIATTENIGLSMSRLSELFYKKKENQFNNYVDGRQMGTSQIHPTAEVAQNVFVGENVQIEAGVVILSGVTIMSNVTIGEGTKVFPHVSIYNNVQIGKHCRIHSGVVIGSDGFGYQHDQGVHHKIWHNGGVVIEDHVEIGALSNIAGGTFGPTKIGSGSKLDCQVQVAHNCQIGKGVVLCGQVGIAGSSTLGDYCVLGGKAGIGPDVTLGKGCQVAGAAQVNTSWPAGTTLGGYPARPIKEWLRGLAYLRKMSLSKKAKDL